VDDADTLAHAGDRASNPTLASFPAAKVLLFSGGIHGGMLEAQREQTGGNGVLRDGEAYGRVFLPLRAIGYCVYTGGRNRCGVSSHRFAEPAFTTMLHSPKKAIVAALCGYRPSVVEILPMYVILPGDHALAARSRAAGVGKPYYCQLCGVGDSSVRFAGWVDRQGTCLAFVPEIPPALSIYGGWQMYG